VKTEFKVRVKVSRGSVEAKDGDSLQLDLKEDSIRISGTTCPRNWVDNGQGYLECPVPERTVSAQFPPSAINAVVHGQAVNFIGIIWNLDGNKSVLSVEPNQRDFSSIVGFLEKVTGKKSVDVDTQAADPPRVLLGSNSNGANLAAYRDQSMEMARDFKDVCPIVQVTINEQKADFTVRLNHIEQGIIIRDNQIEVYNKDGDLISGNEGGSIMYGVKDACILITTEWAAGRF
jgi:hypothetical protein